MKIESISELKTRLQQKGLTEHKYENVELKRDWSKEHGVKVSMLCNGQPNEQCFLVIGVEDNGALSGHGEEWLSSKLEILSQHFNQYLDPVITLLDITTEDVDGSKLIIATVKNPGVVIKWQGNAFIGNGTTKRKLEPEEILELSLSLPGLTDLTKKKSSYMPLQELVGEFCTMGAIQLDEHVLERYHISDTKCGELLVGSGKYRFVKYDSEGNVHLNETRIGLVGLLSEKTHEEIRQYYMNCIPNSSLISDAMLREAIGNCVGHAAYQENDGEIIVELHPNRISISNLAYKEYTSLANKWFSSAHKSPNPFLMETLRLINKVDELGRGKKKLFSECLMRGFNAPVVTISDAGRFKRWSLLIRFEESSERFNSLRKALTEQYDSIPEKGLIAYALVLWSYKPFSEIAKYFDSHEYKIAAEIISDSKGPVFYWKEKDKIILHRWVKVLLEEGKASKGFTMHEEKELYQSCLEIHNQFYSGLITSKQFREIAHLSNSGSDKSLASRTLSKWERENKLKKIKRGTYKFLESRTVEIEKTVLRSLLDAFSDKGKDA